MVEQCQVDLCYPLDDPFSSMLQVVNLRFVSLDDCGAYDGGSCKHKKNRQVLRTPAKHGHRLNQKKHPAEIKLLHLLQTVRRMVLSGWETQTLLNVGLGLLEN